MEKYEFWFVVGSQFLYGPEVLDIVAERAAEMALKTEMLNPEAKPIEQYLLDKHYMRKHGPNAYYGQK